MREYIHENWEFCEEGKEIWMSAKVPGNNILDLLQNNIIDDPYYRDNEKKVQWIEEKDWVYRTFFKVEDDKLHLPEINLVFEGLDTYAAVFLNGNKILESDNMFRRYSIPCKALLSAGQNELLIHFSSPVKKTLPLKKSLPYKVFGVVEGAEQENMVAMMSRKAQYHFGWDWGPRLVCSGVWKSVYVDFLQFPEIKNVYFHQSELSDSRAELLAEIEVYNPCQEITAICCRVLIDDKVVTTEEQELKAGGNKIKLPFKIRQPKLWWPHGYGEPWLYSAKIQVLIDNTVTSEFKHEIGLRTIELITDSDAQGDGSSFYFRVNGVAVFARGANYLPQDTLLNRTQATHYETLLHDAIDANMNMIRVWGGGIYEDDFFYQLCDKKGLLVWHDFMFACAIYPVNKAFLDNAAVEAKEQVQRLRNHPSLALWCGNNEVFEMLHGIWKESLTEKITEGYHQLFHELLPSIVKKYASQIDYWPSSPMADYHGQKAVNPKSGDMHFWRVWHFKEPFSAYLKKENTGRFMSEFGFQSFPDVVTIKKFIKKEDLDILSPVMKNHQKHPSGNSLIRHYLLHHYHEPKDFGSFVYVSQIVQADAMKTAIEHYRRNKPWTMGSLYWQLNDCWPVASWAGRDYFGRWKALHYFAKKFYHPVIVSPYFENDNLNISVVSDLLHEMNLEITMVLYDFKGNTIKKQTIYNKTAPNASSIVYSQPVTEYLREAEPERCFFYCMIKENTRFLHDNILFFKDIKDLQLESPNIHFEIKKGNTGNYLELNCDSLAKNVFLEVKDAELQFSDNYFDLIPGKGKQVTIKGLPEYSLHSHINNLSIQSLIDAF